MVQWKHSATQHSVWKPANKFGQKTKSDTVLKIQENGFCGVRHRNSTSRRMMKDSPDGHPAVYVPEFMKLLSHFLQLSMHLTHCFHGYWRIITDHSAIIALAAGHVSVLCIITRNGAAPLSHSLNLGLTHLMFVWHFAAQTKRHPAVSWLISTCHVCLYSMMACHQRKFSWRKLRVMDSFFLNSPKIIVSSGNLRLEIIKSHSH